MTGGDMPLCTHLMVPKTFESPPNSGSKGSMQTQILMFGLKTPFFTIGQKLPPTLEIHILLKRCPPDPKMGGKASH